MHNAYTGKVWHFRKETHLYIIYICIDMFLSDRCVLFIYLHTKQRTINAAFVICVLATCINHSCSHWTRMWCAQKLVNHKSKSYANLVLVLYICMHWLCWCVTASTIMSWILHRGCLAILCDCIHSIKSIRKIVSTNCTAIFALCYWNLYYDFASLALPNCAKKKQNISLFWLAWKCMNGRRLT